MSTDPPEAERTIIRAAGAPETTPSPADRMIIAAAGVAAAGNKGSQQPGGARIAPGDVLNHIYKVTRFLARGGMGEVFEGANVNSDERVAIKVILPQLAADPNVLAMFRKEARTLTRLSHPALVQYRVLAQEPQLGVFYIVTEFIDGPNLSDVLGTLKPTPTELIALTRRLAEGLHAAHVLGAVHRDVSPDNVLLEDGRLDRARLIDFGIAKDLDPGQKTIIGDGFAGKLGYVAPEQLGDFDRTVGPWSDVYSLGLVILAVASGHGVDMGGTFVEAIDRRRRGADTSAAPAEIRFVLDLMLAPDPAQRLRSMTDVIAALAPPAPIEAKGVPQAAEDGVKASAGRGRWLISGGITAALFAVAGSFVALRNTATPRPSPASPAAIVTPTSTQVPADPVAAVSAAVVAALPGIRCSWLDLAAVELTPAGLSLAIAGVAGHPAEAEAAVTHAAAASGARIAASDFSGVAPVSSSVCAEIDVFRTLRSTGTIHLSVPQRKFEMSIFPKGSHYAGHLGASPIINLALVDAHKDFALYGIEPDGAISSIIPNRKAFTIMPKNRGQAIADLGGGRYRLQTEVTSSGWSGALLLSGDGGFADALVVSGPGERGTEWRARVEAAAAQHHWQAEMVWFKMVDEVKD